MKRRTLGLDGKITRIVCAGFYGQILQDIVSLTHRIGNYMSLSTTPYPTLVL